MEVDGVWLKNDLVTREVVLLDSHARRAMHLPTPPLPFSTCSGGVHGTVYEEVGPGERGEDLIVTFPASLLYGVYPEHSFAIDGEARGSEPVHPLQH